MRALIEICYLGTLIVCKNSSLHWTSLFWGPYFEHRKGVLYIGHDFTTYLGLLINDKLLIRINSFNCI